MIYLKNNWEKLGQRRGEEKGSMGYLPLPQLRISVLHINESVGEKKGTNLLGIPVTFALLVPESVCAHW